MRLPEFERKGICVDIETLGTSPDTVILSIGACVWNLDSNTVSDCYYSEIKSTQFKRTTDADTLEWWKIQRELGTHFPDGKESLRTVLGDFCAWTAKHVGPIYSNGTDFDITILTHALKQEDYLIPWAYYAVRDYRTLRQLFPHVKAPQANSKKHHAMYDAIYETQHLLEILRHIDENKPS